MGESISPIMWCLWFITGPPTRSVGEPVLFCFLASVVVVCNTPWWACRQLHPLRPGDDIMPPAVYSSMVSLHGGPVVLRLIRATPCYLGYSFQI